jgi:hypothetical protein
MNHNLLQPAERSDGNMVAYEFYLRDQEKGLRLLGILPERRKNPSRMGDESIMNWARLVFSETVDFNDIFYVTIVLERNGEGNYFPRPRG